MFNLRGRHIVETDLLAQHVHASDLVIVDGSLHLPTEQRDARAEFATEHIRGALFFDINDVSDHSSSLPHMLPSEAVFASKMQEMGIGDGVAVVAYDTKGLYSAARVWWMLRVMGHENVAVLNGGLPKWKAEGYPVTKDVTPAPSERHFKARMNSSLVRNINDIKTIVQTNSEQIIDARAEDRFHGTVLEPRRGLRSGHIPGAKNVPFISLQNDDGTLKAPAEMRAVFAEAGVDIARLGVNTCGSGITACVLSLALARLGNPDVPVYDGSWAEWGEENSGCEVVT